MEYDDILKKLKSLSNPKAIKGMARYVIIPESTYGVSIPNLNRKTENGRRKNWKGITRAIARAYLIQRR